MTINENPQSDPQFDADYGDFLEATYDADQAAWEAEAEAARAEAIAEAEMAFYDYEPSPYFGDYSEM